MSSILESHRERWRHRLATGLEKRCGDVISYNGQRSKVVFVIERGEYSPDFPEKDWSHHKCGFMIRFDNSALLMLEDADEDLAIVTRVRAEQ